MDKRVKPSVLIPSHTLSHNSARLWLLFLCLISLLPLHATIPLEDEQRSAYMAFLYRYMALPDRCDYEPAFYRENVTAAMRSRREMPWGPTVPEREFQHFVLPVRVNNETLDSSRVALYAELRERVAHLSMSEAILEVNHWCHEHVTYRPTDARTSSPLATLRTAYGRCGEESTLLVAALRAVCIPARQVYTPRWAHTDDNHAWVEAWADGRWHFLGACEPEPGLNLGWFNESASRGMLMHTKVFGDYDGPEEVVSRTPCYTEINVTSNYAPTARLTVQVNDVEGRAVSGALVEFKLYNYAEFYTVVQKTTDGSGRASLSAGLGDMLLWVSKDGRTAIRKVTFGKDSIANMTLGDNPLPSDLILDMTPPQPSAVLPAVTKEQRAENNRRLNTEDSIRHAYERTMPVEKWRGNHEVISRFLNETANRTMAERLLQVLSEKDLRDVELQVLRDNESAPTDTTELYCRYVLCPRVENEWLTPYKAFFRKALADKIKSPEAMVAWCADSIRLDNDRNPQQLRMRPMSVYRHRVTDDLGRKIFFVSACRSLGFPARINEVDGALQYYAEGSWHDVTFGKSEERSSRKQTATLYLDYQPADYCDDPKYYIHFTLSRLTEGRAQLLTYPEEATWKRDFSQGITLPDSQCDYLLTTGTRMANGKVLARIQRIKSPVPTATCHFTLREDKDGVQVVGSFNAENVYRPLAEGARGRSLLSSTGRGYYVVGIVAPNQEPTNHALRDISACRKDLEAWGRKMLLLFESDDDARRFNFSEFPQLPSNVLWGVDADGKCLSEIRGQLKLPSSQLPIFLVCDTFNRVLFVQQGYTIHLGEQLLKVIRKL